MAADGFCAQNTEGCATVTARRDGCRWVLCTEHRRLCYSDCKKRWLQMGSVHRTQKAILQWLQEKMAADGFCAQNTEDYATVIVRRDGFREVLCTEHRRLCYSGCKKRWIQRGSVHRTQKAMLQWLQEEMAAGGFCVQNTEDYATVTARRGGFREALCTEHRRLRYSDCKKRWLQRGSVHTIRDMMGGGARSRCLRFGEQTNPLHLPVIQYNTTHATDSLLCQCFKLSTYTAAFPATLFREN
jgi:hypothetical protein